MKKFLLAMVSNGSEVSVKRVITFAGFLVFLLLVIIDYTLKAVWNINVSPNEQLMSILEWVILGGMGGTVLEKFTSKKSTVDVKVEEKHSN